MNLVIDQGNTKTKATVFDNDKAITTFYIDKDDDTLWVEPISKKYNIVKCIMSSVVKEQEWLEDEVRDSVGFFLLLDENTPVPVKTEYKTRETLGTDRIAAVVGADFLQPGKNILVIDMGTAITYEVIKAPGIYTGGNISPGLTTRFRALNEFTEQLPLVEEQKEVPLIGTNTHSAILAGVVNGIIYEIEGYIDALKAIHDDLFVFLTGGQSHYFVRRLKKTIFAAPDLVSFGLNRILEYNTE